MPATPDYCAVILPTGQFVGGVQCGSTSEGDVSLLTFYGKCHNHAKHEVLTDIFGSAVQLAYFAQLPGKSCSSSCECDRASGQACTSLGAPGTPRFCYYLAPRSCFDSRECCLEAIRCHLM